MAGTSVLDRFARIVHGKRHDAMSITSPANTGRRFSSILPAAFAACTWRDPCGSCEDDRDVQCALIHGEPWIAVMAGNRDVGSIDHVLEPLRMRVPVSVTPRPSNPCTNASAVLPARPGRPAIAF